MSVILIRSQSERVYTSDFAEQITFELNLLSWNAKYG